MACKEQLEAYLRKHHVPFEVQQHPAAFTAQDVAASEHLPGEMVAKVVIVFVDGEMTMVVGPANHRMDLSKIAATLGANEVRLAEEREFAAVFPECEIGAMPPFGNLYGLPVYVDQIIAEDDQFVFQAGTHTDTISMKYTDFARLVSPIVVEITREVRTIGYDY